MKIDEIHIENFRSLREISMTNVGNLVTIIGANSSGKSNLLEALEFFFTNFDPAPQRSLGFLADYVWFDRNSDKPIEITLKFSLTKDEATKIIPKNWHKSISENNTLLVSRKVYGPTQNTLVKTTLIQLNGQSLYSDNNPPVVPPPAQVQPPQQAPPVQQLDPQTAELLRNIHIQFSKTFKTIPASRNYLTTQTAAGQRNSIIQPNILQELTTIGNSDQIAQQNQWDDIENTIVNASKEIADVRVTAGQITVKEKENKSRFPISLIGGGNQELFTLAHQLSTPFTIYGIEEPETHLHPHLARKIFDIFKEVSQSNQLIITTHSTVFVDQSDLQNTWITTKKSKETKIEKLESAQELHKVLMELGVRPSDIFYSNAILFVEGHVDKLVYPLLASKININFDDYGLSVIPIRGSGSGRYHIPVWIQAVKNTKLPFFMILDKDAQKEVEPLLKEKILKKGENLFLLENGSIENYYPLDKVYQAIKSVYSFELSPEEKSNLEKNLTSEMPKLLEAHGSESKGWKSIIGEEVAKNLTPEDIDNELRRILERINSNLSIAMK